MKKCEGPSIFFIRTPLLKQYIEDVATDEMNSSFPNERRLLPNLVFSKGNSSEHSANFVKKYDITKNCATNSGHR